MTTYALKALHRTRDQGLPHVQGVTMPSPIPARFRPVADVAYATRRPHRTIRTWAAEERIPKVYDRGRLLVDLVAASKLSEQAGRRNRTGAGDSDR